MPCNTRYLSHRSQFVPVSTFLRHDRNCRWANHAQLGMGSMESRATSKADSTVGVVRLPAFERLPLRSDYHDVNLVGLKMARPHNTSD